MSRRLSTWKHLCFLGGLALVLTACGCQSFRRPGTSLLPWSSTAGLPSQWEPEVKTSTQ